jgi:CheY-like chemotaxis protein
VRYKSVLVLEDEPLIAFYIKHTLEAEGFVVFLAENGAEALFKLEALNDEHLPCLILCDLQMPVMSGWEFVERASKTHKVMTIIIHSTDEVTTPGYKAVHKPIDRTSLLAIVREHCGSSPKDVTAGCEMAEGFF